MKLASIFFKASASIFEVYLRDTNKRARNMKLKFDNLHKLQHL